MCMSRGADEIVVVVVVVIVELDDDDPGAESSGLVGAVVAMGAPFVSSTGARLELPAADSC